MVGNAIIPQPGSNHIDISDVFYERLEQIKKDLPPDITTAIGFDNTEYIRQSISEVQQTIYLAFGLVVMIIFLTEITSNTATASLLLPVAGALASATGVHPYGLMVAAVVAASFAFMLPVATPPNAIVYGSRYVKAGLFKGIFYNRSDG